MYHNLFVLFWFVFNLRYKELEITFLLVAGVLCVCEGFFPFVVREIAVASWDKEECCGNGETFDDASQIVPGDLGCCHHATCFQAVLSTPFVLFFCWERRLIAQDCGKVTWETLSSC